MEEYIEKIINNGNPDDMYCLNEILVEVLYKIKDSYPEEYKKYATKIKGMAYNYQIDEELAEEIVKKMRPLGEYWDMETIRGVTMNNNHSVCDMYVVMNSLVNDYQNVINKDDAETYIKMANAWIDDVDGKEHKIWWYFVK